MRFLLDQDVYAATARFLRAAQRDVVVVSEIGRSRATDPELLTLAQDTGRILVARDRDFGNLVFSEGPATGVVYLRIEKSSQAVHRELAVVLERYSEDELRKSFVVVRAGGHRIRMIPK